jgi:hypothetical protein
MILEKNKVFLLIRLERMFSTQSIKLTFIFKTYDSRIYF